MTDSGSTLSTCACAFLPAGGAARLARACSHSRRMARRTATLVDWAPGMAVQMGAAGSVLCAGTVSAAWDSGYAVVGTRGRNVFRVR